MRIRLVLTSVALLTLVACNSEQMSDAGSGNEPPVAGNPADGTLTISDAPVDLLPLTVRDAPRQTGCSTLRTARTTRRWAR